MAERPSPEEIARWHRYFAVETNNRAWDLCEKEGRTEAEDREMLDAAHATSLHWGHVGTAVHHARATLLLAHVHALLGRGEQALGDARLALGMFGSCEAEDWDLAFAHAIVGQAAAALGDEATHAEHYATAVALGRAIAGDEDREIFQTFLARLPRPATAT